MPTFATENALASTYTDGSATRKMSIQDGRTNDTAISIESDGLKFLSQTGAVQANITSTSIGIGDKSIDATDMDNVKKHARDNTPGNAVAGKNAVFSADKDLAGINDLGAATVTATGAMTADSIAANTGVTAASVTASGDVGAATVTASGAMTADSMSAGTIKVKNPTAGQPDADIDYSTAAIIKDKATVISNFTPFDANQAGKFFKIAANGTTEYADAGGATPIRDTVNELINVLSSPTYEIGSSGVAFNTGSTFLKLGTLANPYYYLQSSASLSAGIHEITSGNYKLSGSDSTPATYDTSLTYTGATNTIVIPDEASSAYMHYQFIVKDEVAPLITLQPDSSLSGKHTSPTPTIVASAITGDNKFNHTVTGYIKLETQVFTDWVSDSSTAYPYNIQVQDQGSDSATTTASLLYKYINLSFQNLIPWVDPTVSNISGNTGAGHTSYWSGAGPFPVTHSTNVGFLETTVALPSNVTGSDFLIGGISNRSYVLVLSSTFTNTYDVNKLKSISTPWGGSGTNHTLTISNLSPGTKMRFFSLNWNDATQQGYGGNTFTTTELSNSLVSMNGGHFGNNMGKFEYFELGNGTHTFKVHGSSFIFYYLGNPNP